MLEAIIGNRWLLLHAAPSFLGLMLPIAVALVLVGNKPSSLADAALAGFGFFLLSVIVGYVGKPVIDVLQSLLKKIPPYPSRHRSLEDILSFRDASERTALQRRLKGSDLRFKAETECALMEIVERWTALAIPGVMIGAAILFAGDAATRAIVIYLAVAVATVLALFARGPSLVEDCRDWLDRALT